MNKTVQAISQPAERKKRRRLVRWAVAIALVVAGIGVVAAGIGPRSFALWIEDLGLQKSGIGAPIAFFFIALLLVSVILPKTIVSISAGALFGSYIGSILIVLISVVAAALNYGVGRWWFRDSILNRINQQNDGNTDNQSSLPAWAVAIHGISAQAGYGPHLLLRFASIPSMLIGYFMGAVGARLAPFMTAAVIGILPQLLWVHSGAIASVDSDQISTGRWVSTLLSIFAAIAVTVILPREILKRIREQQTFDSAEQGTYNRSHSSPENNESKS